MDPHLDDPVCPYKVKNSFPFLRTDKTSVLCQEQTRQWSRTYGDYDVTKVGYHPRVICGNLFNRIQMNGHFPLAVFELVRESGADRRETV